MQTCACPSFQHCTSLCTHPFACPLTMGLGGSPRIEVVAWGRAWPREGFASRPLSLQMLDRNCSLTPVLLYDSRWETRVQVINFWCFLNLMDRERGGHVSKPGLLFLALRVEKTWLAGQVGRCPGTEVLTAKASAKCLWARVCQLAPVLPGFYGRTPSCQGKRTGEGSGPGAAPGQGCGHLPCSFHLSPPVCT